MTYSDQLRDVRWQRRALEIKQAANWRCQHCGRGEPATKQETFILHVHHLHYIQGRAPWEYPDALLVALCKDCHEGTHEATDALRSALAVALRNTHHSQVAKVASWMMARAMEELP